MSAPLYFDNHATTPLDPRVLDAMLPFLGSKFGNPGSKAHSFGWTAEAAVDLARARVAALLGCSPEEIVFTSGATEANNLALLGAVAASRAPEPHVVTAATEHHAVLDTCREIERRGGRLTVLPVDSAGSISLQALERALSDGALIVSLMAANNEVGTLHPLAEIGRMARAAGVLFHSDAAQAVGKVPLAVKAMEIDILSLAAHKFHGPKGVGALYVRSSVRRRIAPQQFGGGQEGGLRPGTLNVPGIVGLGMACHVALSEMESEAARVLALRNRLEAGLRRAAPELVVNGHPILRLPGNLSVTLPGTDAEALLLELRSELALSAGAACATGLLEPSHVLRAMGRSEGEARSTLRFGLGRTTTEAEVDQASASVAAALLRLRAR